MRLSNHQKHSRYRRGAIMPLVGFVLLVLLIAGGVAIEQSRLRLASLELQAASDNAARSCANELLLTDSQSAARTRAKSIAAQYSVANRPFVLRDEDVVFGRTVNDTFIPNSFPPNAVQVSATRSSATSAGPVNMIFGSLFGVSSANMKRDAVASFRIVDICFVLDRSTSMKLDVNSNEMGMLITDPRAPLPPLANSRWHALRLAFNSFLSELAGNGVDERVGVTSFASDFTAFGVTTPASSIDLNLTSNLALAQTSMDALSSSVWNGNTFIEAGMLDGITVLSASRANAEKIMVVLTDGYQNQGDARNAANLAVAENIKIHTIAFGTFADKALMAEIALLGNGRFGSADDAASLTQILKDLAASLTSLVR
jgi:Flp pilus assembly protein TadG